MGTIDDMKSALTQSALDALCEKFHIPHTVHPELPGRNNRIRNSPTGKIGVYTRFFDFANYRIPLSQFLVDGISVDLFAFINHADPTKVRIGEREVKEGEVPLLELTRGRVVPLAGVNEQGNQNDDVQDDGVHVHEVPATIAEKAKVSRKKRKATRGASGSSLPPKKLRDNHGTFWAGASTGEKSVTTLQSLLERNTLPVEVGVMAVATLPFITSSVCLTPERERVSRTDSVTGPHLRTQHLTERFAVLSDSPCHSSSNASGAEVSSVVRSLVLDPLIMTTAVATMAVVAASSVPVLRAVDEPVHASIFGDSTSAGTVGPDIAGPSQPAGIELSADTFYVSQDMDSETLRQLCGMDYDQLFAEFNVKAARQTCLGTEVRMPTEHILREKKTLKGRFSRQADLLKERDVKIASLKAQLSLKEAKATEAIRLRGQVSVAEAMEAARVAEMNSLKEQTTALKGQVAALESATVIKDTELTSSNAQIAKLTQDVSNFQLSCDELSVKAASLESEKINLLIKCLCWRPHVLGSVMKSGRRWILGRGLRLVVMKCLQSPEYLAALGGAIGRAIDKGMQDGLAVDVVHAHVQSIRGDAASHRLSLSNAMVPLIKPLSAENLVGEANTSGAAAAVAATTALSTTFIHANSVPPVPASDYEVADAEPQVEASSSPKIMFEQETLETSPEDPTT
ncbi:hypothetical protein Tco_0620961 [Tanacetum coccineum]